jgi:hypothetical protein
MAAGAGMDRVKSAMAEHTGEELLRATEPLLRWDMHDRGAEPAARAWSR